MPLDSNPGAVQVIADEVCYWQVAVSAGRVETNEATQQFFCVQYVRHGFLPCLAASRSVLYPGVIIPDKKKDANGGEIGEQVSTCPEGSCE